jgi:hypothetical protein
MKKITLKGSQPVKKSMTVKMSKYPDGSKKLKGGANKMVSTTANKMVHGGALKEKSSAEAEYKTSQIRQAAKLPNTPMTYHPNSERGKAEAATRKATMNTYNRLSDAEKQKRISATNTTQEAINKTATSASSNPTLDRYAEATKTANQNATKTTNSANNVDRSSALKQISDTNKKKNGTKGIMVLKKYMR